MTYAQKSNFTVQVGSKRYVDTDQAQVIEAVETIPALTERKVVGLPDAENRPIPPAITTSSDDPRSETPQESPAITPFPGNKAKPV